MSLIREGLLALSTVAPAYGLQLRNELASRTQRPINGGQAYSTLERLVRDGLVTEVGRTVDALALFEATPAGRAHCERWLSTPLPEFSDMVFQVVLARSLPGVSTQSLLRRYREHWSQALQLDPAADVTDANSAGGAAAVSARLRHAADETLAHAALSWLETVAATSDAGWEFTAERPKRGRRPKATP